MGRLQDKRLFLLDMDGTIYLDDRLFDGVTAFLSRIREKGGRYLFLTNNSSKGIPVYDSLEKLNGKGDVIIDFSSPAAVEKALPYCNIVCITGSEMKDKLSGYLQVLADAEPSSVGGTLPGDDFYYGG